MKQHYFSHVIWGCLVIVAYVMGSRRSTDREGSSLQESLRSTDSASVLVSETERRAKSSASSDAEQIADPLGRRRPLDADAIVALGEQFKNARQPTEGRLAYARLLERLTPENALQIREQLVHLDPMSAEFREFHYAWGEIAGREAVLHGAGTPERDVSVTLAGWARTDPKAAMAWVSSIEDDAGFNKADLEYGIAHGLSLTNPEAAGAYLASVSEGGDPTHAGKMLGMISSKLFQAHGPNETASWAQSLPRESPIRAAALHRVFEQWSKNDPESASAHLVDMPASQDRDAAIGGFATRLVWEDPVSAIAWTREITDFQTQEHVLVSIGRTYLKRQPQAAKEWLQTANISPEVQEQILNASE